MMPLLRIKRSVAFRYRITRKCFRNIQEFQIGGTRNYHDSPDYLRNDLADRFTPSFEEFKRIVIELTKSDSSATFYKFGDGDYYFLRGEEYGSAKPGNRALSRKYSEIDLARFNLNALSADYYMCEIPEADRLKFNAVFPNKAIDFPAEYVYAGVASRWFFDTFDGEIALIGAKEKLELIGDLLQYEEYRKYLGIKYEFDLITIPQKFACDDLDATLEILRDQISNSKARVFLFGVGHVKSGIISELKLMHPGVFIDIGSGIDALAGVIDITRPYFGGWRNFKLQGNSRYEDLDLLQVSNLGKIKKLK